VWVGVSHVPTVSHAIAAHAGRRSVIRLNKPTTSQRADGRTDGRRVNTCSTNTDTASRRSSSTGCDASYVTQRAVTPCLGRAEKRRQRIYSLPQAAAAAGASESRIEEQRDYAVKQASERASERGLTFPSTRDRSFRRRVFTVNHMHR